MNSTLTQAAPAAETHAHATACLNCDAPLSSRYCPHCGQPADTHRFTLGHLLHEIPHSVWHVDRGLPYTLREMLLRPGATVRRYLAGERVRYFRPFALVLLMAGLLSFLTLSLHIQFMDTQAAAHNAAAAQEVAVNQLVFKYFAWFTVAMLPAYALCSWLLLRRLRYNFAEHLIGNALIMGGIILVQVVFLPLLAWSSGTPAFGLVFFAESFMMPVFHVWAFTQLVHGAYRLGGAFWRGTAAAVLGLVLNTVLIQLLATAIISLRH